MHRLFLPLLLVALLLPGCAREDDFDKKYEATGARLKAEMKRLDQQLDTELKQEPGAQTGAEPTPSAD
jgi:hypothetical protein